MWSLKPTERAAPAALMGLLLCACSSAPPRTEPPKTAVPPSTQPAAASSAVAPAPGPPAGGGAAAPGAPAAPPAPVPARATADFGRAVGMMRTGKTTEAELEFQQISVTYPQFAGPDINLGILRRRAGQLEQSEKALRAAVEHDSSSAVAWNELGVTLRMRGRFHEAADAYNRAIAADANFAPAYRNLGVLLDLYLGDAPGALAALEHYKQLTGEEKPVNGWIAELRARAGKAAASAAGAAASQPASPAAGPPGTQPAQAPSSTPAAPPGTQPRQAPTAPPPQAAAADTATAGD